MATKRGQENIHISFHNGANTASYLAKSKMNTAKLPNGFLAVPDYKKEVPGSVKLHWDKLNRTLNGVRTPMEDKGWITRRFNELAKQGWEVTKR